MCLLCKNLRLRAFRRVEIVLSKILLFFFQAVNTGLNHVVRVSNHIQNKKTKTEHVSLINSRLC